MTADGRAGRKTQARGRASRAVIVETMLDLVDEKGFEKATLAQLAKRTGLPASSVYWQFDSKDQIVAAGLEESLHLRPEGLSWPRVPDERPLVEQLQDALAQLEGSTTEADHARVGLSLMLQRQSSAAHARHTFMASRAALAADLTTWWKAVLEGRAHGPVAPHAPETLSRFTLAIIEGRRLTRADIRVNAEQVRILALVLEGITDHYLHDGQTPPLRPLTERVPHTPDPDAPTPERLIAAAIEEMCDHGPVGTTVAAVCQRAGVPASSLYWHFTDLNTLLTEAFDTAFGRWEQFARPWRAVEPSPAWAAEIGTEYSHGFEVMLAEPDAFRIGFMLLLARVETGPGVRFRQIRREILQDRAEWLARSTGLPLPDPGAAVVSTSSAAGRLAWAALTVVDGLFLLEAAYPRWPLTATGEGIAAGLGHAAAALLDD